MYVPTGGPLRRIAHRNASRIQDRALERIDGTNVWFVGTSSDEGSESNLAKDDAYGWIDPAVLPQAIPCRREHNPEIRKFTALQAGGDRSGVCDGGLHTMTASLFEFRNEFSHRRGQRIRAEETDFRRAQSARCLRQ